MSLVSKNSEKIGSLWEPSATIATLKARTQLLHNIRTFFHSRNVIEVDTPLLGHTSVTDPYIQSIPAQIKANGFTADTHTYYLQTSPEYAMKRLLAAGSGPIYQICKAFRQDEIGSRHNPEFTMLEWYRPGFDHHQLMDEMDALLQTILHTPSAMRMSYRECFMQYLAINPLTSDCTVLKNCAINANMHVQDIDDDKDTWLQLLMSHLIEPQLGKSAPCFIYDFPASQSALAKVQASNPPVASRFEVYAQGMELANGFHELSDAQEQRRRFEQNNQTRKELGLMPQVIDEYLLAALEHGLPDCAGVALGIDRLVMLALGKHHIQDVISFDIQRA